MENRDVSLPRKLFSAGLIVFLIGLVIFTGLSYPLRVIPFPYWLYRAAIDHSTVLCVGILPVGVLIAITQAAIWRKRRIAALIVTVSGLLLGCAAAALIAWTLLLTVLGYQTHHDSLVTESHVYHLSSEWKIGVGRASRAVYLLWQCDKTQIACSIVYSQRIPPIYDENAYRTANAALELDSQTRAIDIVLDGEIVYAFKE